MIGSGQIGLSNPMDCHLYLIEGGEGELALVDAGVGLEPELIIENIRQAGFDENDIKYLLLTHGHSDHAAGCKYMKEQTGCKIVTTEVEARLLEKGTDEELGIDITKRSGIYPEDFVYPHTKADLIVKDGDKIKVGKYEISALVVPGHSPGPACFFFNQNDYRIMFSGDVVFFGGTIGLGNWPGSTLADYRENIGKLINLSVDALLPGHFLWTLKGGQGHLDTAIANLKEAWVPPLWQHQHPAF